VDIKELDSLINRFEFGETDLFDILEKEYSKLVEDNPGNVKYIREYGLLYQRMGRRYLEKAEKVYESLLFKDIDKNDPDYFRIDIWLINLRNTLGKNKDSIELYKKRILEYPDDPDEYGFLAQAYLHADQVQEARKVMEAAEKIVPDCFTNAYSHCNFYEGYGDIYARLGENEKALGYWDKSVANEFGMGGWFKRAFMFKDLGRLEEAASEWKRIVKMLERHNVPQYLEWPKEELAKIEILLNK
jgi:tetratricopeptide (TPR) repeat protein